MKAPKKVKKAKVHISFDSEKRLDYLSGFHKRKQQRRKFGHDYEAYKIRKKQLEARKQVRNERKSRIEEAEKNAKLRMGLINDDQDDENSCSENCNESSSSVSHEKKNQSLTKFDDEHTKEKFGDVVTVTTTLGIPESDSSDHESETFIPKRKQQPEEHLTLFQRIQKKRKGISLPKKKKTKDGRIKAALQQSFKKIGRKYDEHGDGKKNMGEGKLKKRGRHSQRKREKKS